MKNSKESNILIQFNKLKERYQDTILLIRIGDFYETFLQDAITVSKILNTVLATDGKTELTGFPHHRLDYCLPKLVRAGYKVALCDRLECPHHFERIGKFTISIHKESDMYRVVITPGKLSFGTERNLESSYLENDSQGADQRFKELRQYAHNNTVFEFWERLNHVPLPVYLRFQKFVARHHGGKWLRGISIQKGFTNFNFE